MSLLCACGFEIIQHHLLFACYLLDAVNLRRHDTADKKRVHTTNTWKIRVNYRSRSRVNGATQTFRRPSGATNPSQSRESNQFAPVSSTQTAPYIPPHLNSSYQASTLRNGTVNESRYSKDQLLGLYKSQREWDGWGKNVTDYLMADWNPRDGVAPTSAWGKRDDQQKDNSSGPEVCWDHGGQVQPLALVDMSDEEKDVRTPLPLMDLQGAD